MDDKNKQMEFDFMEEHRADQDKGEEEKQYGIQANLVFDSPIDGGLLNQNDAVKYMLWVSDLLARLNIYGGMRLVELDERTGDERVVKPECSIDRSRTSETVACDNV